MADTKYDKSRRDAETEVIIDVVGLVFRMIEERLPSIEAELIARIREQGEELSREDEG